MKEARSILNKLTPENFDRLKLKFLELKLENQENRVDAVINVLFEKAIDEPAFSASYAKMVKHYNQESHKCVIWSIYNLIIYSYILLGLCCVLYIRCHIKNLSQAVA